MTSCEVMSTKDDREDNNGSLLVHVCICVEDMNETMLQSTVKNSYHNYSTMNADTHT